MTDGTYMGKGTGEHEEKLCLMICFAHIKK